MSRVLLSSEFYLDKTMSHCREGGEVPLMLFYRAHDDHRLVGYYSAVLGEDGEIKRTYYGEMFEREP